MMRTRLFVFCSHAALAFALTGAAQSCTLETDLGHWALPGADTDATPDAAPLEPEDGGVDRADCSAPPADAAACTAVDSGSLLTVTPGLTTSYFADGKSFPAGDYALLYVDGCWHSGVVAWTVNLGGEGYWVVGGQPTQPITMAPGTVGTFATLGAYFNYEDCVAANVGSPAVTFHFEGGPLGLKLDSLDPVTFSIGVEGGESAGGLSPTFRLSAWVPAADKKKLTDRR
jgi:hypothetical protein